MENEIDAISLKILIKNTIQNTKCTILNTEFSIPNTKRTIPNSKYTIKVPISVCHLRWRMKFMQFQSRLSKSNCNVVHFLYLRPMLMWKNCNISKKDPLDQKSFPPWSFCEASLQLPGGPLSSTQIQAPGKRFTVTIQKAPKNNTPNKSNQKKRG